MKNTIRNAVMEAHYTENTINTFLAQIGICAVIGGLKTKSWILFGIMLAFPLAIFMLSKRHKVCRVISMILCVAYIALWGVIGFMVGSIFKLSASIVLCIIFLFAGFAYNVGAFNYYRQ